MQSGQESAWFAQFAMTGVVIGFTQGCVLSMLAGGTESLLRRIAYAAFIGLHGALVGTVVALVFGSVFYLFLFRGTLTKVVIYLIGASCIASGIISAVALHVWRHDGSEMMSIFIMPVVAAITALSVKVWTSVPAP